MIMKTIHELNEEWIKEARKRMDRMAEALREAEAGLEFSIKAQIARGDDWEKSTARQALACVKEALEK